MASAVRPGYASRNKWCLRYLLKTGKVKAEEIWVGSLFQTWDAVDEKDFEVAIDVFLKGADMVIEEEDRSDREGVYLGRIWARYKGCWWCSTLKAVVAILKLIRWRTGSQCRPARTGVMWHYIISITTSLIQYKRTEREPSQLIAAEGRCSRQCSQYAMQHSKECCLHNIVKHSPDTWRVEKAFNNNNNNINSNLWKLRFIFQNRSKLQITCT